MPVSEDEEVDFGMLLTISFCIEHERLFLHLKVFVFIGMRYPAFRLPFQSLLTAMEAPAMGKAHRPARMNGAEQSFENRIAESLVDKIVGKTLRAVLFVSMRQAESFAQQFYFARISVDNGPHLFLQIIAYPYIVISGKEMDLHPRIVQLCQLAQKARETARHNAVVFIPVVKHIPQQIESYGILFNMLQPATEAALHTTRIFMKSRTQMCIAGKIDTGACGAFRCLFPILYRNLQEAEFQLGFFAHHILVPLRFESDVHMAFLNASYTFDLYFNSSTIKSAAGQFGAVRVMVIFASPFSPTSTL